MYDKTIWINGLEPFINEVNLNKIEQGIFDNSALIDGMVGTDTTFRVVANTSDLTNLDNNIVQCGIVKDRLAGGVFVFDSTRILENDGGLVFDGWVRIFEGRPKLRYFGALDDGSDSKNIIIDVMNKFGFIDIDSDVYSSTILASNIIGDVQVYGNKESSLISIGNTRFIEYDTVKTSHNITFKDVVLDGFDGVIFPPGTLDGNNNVQVIGAGSTIKNLIIEGNTLINCTDGFVCTFNNIKSGRCTNNTFKEMVSIKFLRGVIIGSNNQNVPTTKGNYIIENNTFESLISSALNQEVHAIALYGEQGIISGNTIKKCINNPLSTTGGEAIYTKLKGGKIFGNAITDGGYSNDGAIAIKGRNSTNASTAPYGYGTECFSNSIIFTDLTNTKGIGIFIQNDYTNVHHNYIEGATDFSISGGTEGETVNIDWNIIKDNHSKTAINFKGAVNNLSITRNKMNMIAQSGDTINSILVTVSGSAGGNYEIDGLDLSDNITTINEKNDIAGYLTNSVRNIILRVDGTTSNGRKFKNVEINNNKLKLGILSNATYLFYGIGSNSTFNPIVSGLEITNNKSNVIPNSGIFFNTAWIMDRVKVERNEILDISYNTQKALEWNDVDTVFIQNDGNLNAGLNIRNAELNKHYTFIQDNNSEYRIDVLTGVFRGGFSRMTMTGNGSTKVRVLEDGIYDIESTSNTLVFT